VKRDRILFLIPPAGRPYSRDRYRTTIIKACYCWPPLDFLVQSGFLAPQFDVSVIDTVATRLPPERCRRRILQLQPAAVFFLTCSASWREDFAFVASLKRDLPGTRMIAGGGFLLFKGRQVLEASPFLDAVLLSFTTADLRKYLQGEAPSRNILYRRNGRIVETERACSPDLRIPIPRHDLFPLGKYVYPVLLSNFTVVNTAVGCPYRCPFCIASGLEYEVRGLDNVMDELKSVHQFGIRRILFGDLTFTADPARTRELARRMREARFDFTWMCETRPDLLDRETLQAMKEAGCRAIHLGAESGDPRILEQWKPGLSPARIREAFGLCRELGILTHAYFMIGLPGQEESGILQTIAFARSLKPDSVSFNLPMPHPGTAFGAASDVPEEAFDERFSFEQATRRVLEQCSVSPARLLRLRRRAYAAVYLQPGYWLRAVTRPMSLREAWVSARLLASLLRTSVLH